ncbi:MAG TPA: hypothetical protein EYG17_10255 [Acidimicrobiia bacterium]|nr:hypothetical protein [Acidimicrobiia bacterium]HIL06417.1 hypothetical protein [Acidimicrobiia bacterium]
MIARLTAHLSDRLNLKPEAVHVALREVSSTGIEGKIAAVCT